jgi:rsbT co-antagonist protein RsbR
MKEELRYIGEKILQNASSIAENIALIQGAGYTRSLDRSGMPLEERMEFRFKIIQYFGQALFEDIDIITDKVMRWSNEAAEFALEYGVSLSDSLRAISTYRTAIWDIFTEELEQRHFAAITMLDVSKILDPLIDRISGIYGEVYERHSTRLINVAYTALDDLSVPVVPIVKGIAVIPLIGEINSRRAQLIMEHSLSKGAKQKLNTIILDLSGVALIDTLVADQLYQIKEAHRLSGIETIITGIRPEIAQTIVHLGLNFSNIRTFSQLQQALHVLGVKRIEE